MLNLGRARYLHSKISSIRNDEQQFFYFLRLIVFAHLIKLHDEVAQDSAYNVKVGAGLKEGSLRREVQFIDVVFDILL